MQIFITNYFTMGTHNIKCFASSYFTQKYTLETLLYNHGRVTFSLCNIAEFSNPMYLLSPILMGI